MLKKNSVCRDENEIEHTELHFIVTDNRCLFWISYLLVTIFILTSLARVINLSIEKPMVCSVIYSCLQC